MLNPDVTEILDDPELGGGVSFTIRRPRLVRSRATVEKSFVPIEATGNIQPVDKSASQDSSEDKLSEQIVIRTTTTLQAGTRDETGATGADEVFYKNSWWRVTRVDNWEDWGFVVAYATRVRSGTFGMD